MLFSCWIMSDSLWPPCAALQASLSMGFPRQEYWSMFPPDHYAPLPTLSCPENPSFAESSKEPRPRGQLVTKTSHLSWFSSRFPTFLHQGGDLWPASGQGDYTQVCWERCGQSVCFSRWKVPMHPALPLFSCSDHSQAQEARFLMALVNHQTSGLVQEKEITFLLNHWSQGCWYENPKINS